MKRYVLYTFAIIAAALAFGFLAWAFSQHGTDGLFHVDGFFRLLFIVLGITVLILILLAVLRAWFSNRNHRLISRILTVLLIILIVLDSVIPIGAFVFTSCSPSAEMENIQPQLLLGYGTGKYGVPDMMAVAYSDIIALNWGKNEPEGKTTTKVIASSVSQHHLLTDLLPGTEYWYSFDGGDKYYFRTPDINETNLHFAVGSDAHFGAGDNRSDLTTKMLQQIASPQNNYDYYFSLGDLVEYGFRDSMWQQALQSITSNLSGIPTGFAVGNHDALFTGLAQYEKYCRPYAPVSSDGFDLWYRVDVGKVHFLFLDVEWSAESYPDEQAAWLEQQLSNIPKEDWKIVLSHGFYYSSGYFNNGWNWYDNPETIERYTQLFEKYGVDLVFSGHNHQMEMLRHSGVTYAVCGAFGGLPDNEQTYISPASLWYASGQYGYVDVTVEAAQANVIFRDPDNQIIKQLIVTK